MTVKDEQLLKAKKQIIEQINQTFPEDKKDSAIQQIESMDDEEFVKFLGENGLMNNQENVSGGKGIFRAILSGQIPSKKIAEDDSSIAVLEINPFSKGHTIIIPKNPINSEEEITKEIFSFIEKVSKMLKEKLEAKKIEISNSNEFGELVINLIPIYDKPKENLKKYKAEESELEEVEKLIFKKPKETIKEEIKKPKTISEKDFWLPKRIP